MARTATLGPAVGEMAARAGAKCQKKFRGLQKVPKVALAIIVLKELAPGINSTRGLGATKGGFLFKEVRTTRNAWAGRGGWWGIFNQGFFF